MLYEYIDHIDDNHKFYYLLVIVGSIFISNRVSASFPTIFGLLIGLLISYYINDKNENQGNTFITSMKKILNYENMYPKQNHYLAKNSELVIFLDQYKEYHSYNPNLWKNMVSSINLLLQAMYDIEHDTRTMLVY